MEERQLLVGEILFWESLVWTVVLSIFYCCMMLRINGFMGKLEPKEK